MAQQLYKGEGDPQRCKLLGQQPRLKIHLNRAGNPYLKNGNKDLGCRRERKDTDPAKTNGILRSLPGRDPKKKRVE